MRSAITRHIDHTYSRRVHMSPSEGLDEVFEDSVNWFLLRTYNDCIADTAL